MNQYGGVFTRILNGREFDQLYNFQCNFYKFLNAYCVVIAIKFRAYSQCLELGYGVTDLWGHMAISSHRMVVPSISTVFPNCLYYFRICLLQLFIKKRWLFVCQLFELLVGVKRVFGVLHFTFDYANFNDSFRLITWHFYFMHLSVHPFEGIQKHWKILGAKRGPRFSRFSRIPGDV